MNVSGGCSRKYEHIREWFEKVWVEVSFSEGGSVKYDLFDGVSWEDMNSGK